MAIFSLHGLKALTGAASGTASPQIAIPCGLQAAIWVNWRSG